METIAAIATAPGESGIGIVRVSGGKARAVGDAVVRLASGKKISECRSFTVHYGWVIGRAKETVIDEVLVTVMKAPRSYTREDTIEINCHGGIAAMRAVLARVLEEGCRPAQPGEFTKRAFLNGRIDLAQAEGVLDVIRAQTDSARSLAVSQLTGSVSRAVRGTREKLIGALSALEAGLDFPDDEVREPERARLLGLLAASEGSISGMLEGADRGRVIREGIEAVLCGRPNAGKSSLLNALLKEERSIVTRVAGTTRDSIEETADILGIPVRLIDTAGIISPRDQIERKAVERAKQWIKRCQLIILVFDGSKPLGKDDRSLLAMARKAGKKVLPVINKTDLRQRLDRKSFSKLFGQAVEISCRTGENMGALERAIAERAAKDFSLQESIVLSNARQTECARSALSSIRSAQDSFLNGQGGELVCQHLREACSRLDEITGELFPEDLLDAIFEDFCIGK